MCYEKTHYALARSFASLEDDTTAKQWCREGKKNGKHMGLTNERRKERVMRKDISQSSLFLLYE